MSARNRTRFVYAFSFSTRHDLCRLRVALGCTQKLLSQGPGSIPAHRTEGVTGYEVGANGFRGGIRVGDRNGDRNGVGGGNGDVNIDEKGDGAGTRTGVEANHRTQDRNENGRRGTGSGRVEERRVCAKKLRRDVDVMWKTRETWPERIKIQTQTCSFSSCQLRQYRK